MSKKLEGADDGPEQKSKFIIMRASKFFSSHFYITTKTYNST